MMRRLLSGLLVAVMVLPLTVGLSGCGSEGKTGNPSHYMLSPENTSVSTDTGITVSLGDYVLEEETELVVTPRPAEEDAEAGYKIESYDFTLGDMTALDDFITIRIPYDDTYWRPDKTQVAVSVQNTLMKLPTGGKTYCLRWIGTEKSW